MKYFRLVSANLWRKPARTLLTLGTIVFAFVLYSLLSAVRLAFSMGVDISGADRLITIHKVSLIRPLPASYGRRMRAVKGVIDVAHASWFGGYYQDKKNVFGQFPVDAESYMRIYPEAILPEDQMRAWMADKGGCIIGIKLAQRFGWKVGDTVPIIAPWRRKDGSATWTFTVRGIYDGANKEFDTTALLFHYDYFNEGRSGFKDMVGWYILRVDDPERSAEISKQIDRMFANSFHETKTTTEKAFAQGFANQIGNIGKMVQAIVAAVFFILLLVVSNTMAQSVNERLNELAVLKTLGFTNLGTLALVLVEASFLALAGGLVGLVLGGLVVWALAGALSQFLPVFHVPFDAYAMALLLIAVLGVVSGAMPAVAAMRLPIATALRRA